MVTLQLIASVFSISLISVGLVGLIYFAFRLTMTLSEMITLIKALYLQNTELIRIVTELYRGHSEIRHITYATMKAAENFADALKQANSENMGIPDDAMSDSDIQHMKDAFNKGITDLETSFDAGDEDEDEDEDEDSLK